MEIMEDEDEDKPPRNVCHLKHTHFASNKEMILSFQENGRLRITEAAELRHAGLSQRGRSSRRIGGYNAFKQIVAGLFSVLIAALLIHFRLIPTSL